MEDHDARYQEHEKQREGMLKAMNKLWEANPNYARGMFQEMILQSVLGNHQWTLEGFHKGVEKGMATCAELDALTLKYKSAGA